MSVSRNRKKNYMIVVGEFDSFLIITLSDTICSVYILASMEVPMIHTDIRDRQEEIFTKASNVQRPIKLKK